MNKLFLLAICIQSLSIYSMEMECIGVEEKSFAIQVIELAVVKSQNELIEEIDLSGREINNLLEIVNAEHKKINPSIIWTIQSYPALFAITKLNLSNNSLQDLPKALKELSHIKDFNGSDNKFKAIPAVARHWKNTLAKLNMSRNQINCIERIGKELLSNFKNLKELKIFQNNVAELPCEELYELYLEQESKQSCILIHVDQEYELSEDLKNIKDKIFITH